MWIVPPWANLPGIMKEPPFGAVEGDSFVKTCDEAACVWRESDLPWEQDEEMSFMDFKVLEYQPGGEIVVGA